ncbi:MAG: double zinc ribbon domain-containing protein [Candidatus Moraniibacteriota bacterium]
MTPSSLADPLRTLRQCLTDIFFPLRCFGCETEGTLACAACLGTIREREYQECSVCRKPYQKNGATCRDCRKTTALDGLFIARSYRHRLLQKLVFALKYRFIDTAADPLAALLAESIAHHPFPLPDLVIPVPLHARRLRFRGFNQAEVLAQKLMVHLLPGSPIPIRNDLLARSRFTKPQMKTDSKPERLANLAEAFIAPLETAGPLVGKHLWLIDDVATTGTTLDECARALKIAGAKTVWGIVIAR